MLVENGKSYNAEGWGVVEVVQQAEFDTIVQIRLDNGETAWTDKSLLRPLDT